MIKMINLINIQFLFLSWINYIVPFLMIACIQPYHSAMVPMPKMSFIVSVHQLIIFPSGDAQDSRQQPPRLNCAGGF